MSTVPLEILAEVQNVYFSVLDIKTRIGTDYELASVKPRKHACMGATIDGLHFPLFFTNTMYVQADGS